MQIRYYTLPLTCMSFLLGGSGIEAQQDGFLPPEPEMPIEMIGNEECFSNNYTSNDCNNDCRTERKGGIWLPEDPVLFKPFVADPRQVDYSVGWRFNDNALVKNVIDISFGDIITFYRWIDVGPCNGQLDISLEGGVWAVFDPLHYSAPLMNADYFVGIPITYAFGSWAFRLRGFHISSHIGDEFLLNHPHFCRKNPSAEYIDFFASYYLRDDIRFYGGLGVVASCDKSFKIGRYYGAVGAELHMSNLGFLDVQDQIYGRPFYGMHFHLQKDRSRHVDQTYVLGYEWGKLVGLQRVFRAFMEYHNGYSWEGQFFKCPTSYFSLRLSYGF